MTSLSNVLSVTFMSDSWDMHQLRQPLDHILVRCPIFSLWMMFTAVVKRSAYRTAATWMKRWKTDSYEGAGVICHHGSPLMHVELQGGTDHSGNVFALNLSGYLGPVCDDNWGNLEANVVCR